MDRRISGWTEHPAKVVRAIWPAADELSAARSALSSSQWHLFDPRPLSDKIIQRMFKTATIARIIITPRKLG